MMEQLKAIIERLLTWFKQLTKQQQLIAVGAMILVAVVTGRSVGNNGIDGTYVLEKSGYEGTLVIHGKTGEGSLTDLDDDEIVKITLDNINVKNQTFSLKSSEQNKSQELKFTKNDKVLTIYKDGSDFTIVFIQK